MLKLFEKTICFVWMTILIGCVNRQENTSVTVDANVNLGITYLQQGNREKARDSLNQAIKNAPKSPLCWTALAYLEEVSENITLANQYYQHAIALAPQLGEVHNNYGAYLCRHQHPSEGIQEFLFAARSPNYIYQAAAWENAGLCALSSADKQAAIDYFQAALRNDPNRQLSLTKLTQLLN